MPRLLLGCQESQLLNLLTYLLKVLPPCFSQSPLPVISWPAGLISDSADRMLMNPVYIPQPFYQIYVIFYLSLYYFSIIQHRTGDIKWRYSSMHKYLITLYSIQTKRNIQIIVPRKGYLKNRINICYAFRINYLH